MSDNEFSHPEIRTGEIFFTNSHKQDYKKIKYETKRLGETSYDGNGNKLNILDWFPVFINKSELVKSSKTLKELRDEWYIDRDKESI